LTDEFNCRWCNRP